MRVLASSRSSPRRPKVSAPDGQTSAQAGFSPGPGGPRRRCTCGRAARSSRTRTSGRRTGRRPCSTGSPGSARRVVDDRPLGLSCPCARTGHAEAHAGARQCMHCFFAKRSRRPPSTLFTTVKAVSDVSRASSRARRRRPAAAGCWFALGARRLARAAAHAEGRVDEHARAVRLRLRACPDPMPWPRRLLPCRRPPRRPGRTLCVRSSCPSPPLRYARAAMRLRVPMTATPARASANANIMASLLSVLRELSSSPLRQRTALRARARPGTARTP